MCDIDIVGNLCILCNEKVLIGEGEPYLSFKNNIICQRCSIDIIEPIYELSGTGGIQHLIYKSCLESSFNKKKRRSLKQNKILFTKLLHKYKFQCQHCGCKDENRLSIDHIKPVSKGGSDNLTNLQILCIDCNRRKGAKWRDI